MAKKDIHTLDNNPDILTHEAKNVPDDMFNTPLLKNYVTDLFDTMASTMAGSISAVKIGIPYKIVAYGGKASVNFPEFHPEPKVLINADYEILNDGLGVSVYEHCTSLPGKRGHTVRANKINVTAQDIDGSPINFIAEGLLSVLLQHTIDHTYGKLFKDCADEFGDIAEFERKYGKSHHKQFSIVELDNQK
ncbi:MAG: peptide deformylase [Pseudomonadota bacterium]